MGDLFIVMAKLLAKFGGAVDTGKRAASGVVVAGV